MDLTGDATQRVFEKVLTNLARSAPPIPGFRREKGGNALLLLVFIIITLFEFTVAYVSFFFGTFKNVPSYDIFQALSLLLHFDE